MKITVVTSSRADWNSTGMVLKALREVGRNNWQAVPLKDEISNGHRVEQNFYENAFDVSLLVMAASGPAFDALKAAIAEDNAITGTIIWHSLNLTKDDPVNLAGAAGDALRFAGEALYALQPDLVFLSGDRWETLSSALAASLAGIPIAHLGGGDQTEGSYDDGFRTSITALASIHFVTNNDALDRLSNWTEATNVYNVGSPSVDRLLTMEFDPPPETERPLIVVNWQPETNAIDPNKGLLEIIKALPKVGDRGTIVFIEPNDDKGSEHTRMIYTYNGIEPVSLTPRAYLSLLKHCDVLVGNSSSGIYEAPYFGKLVVNVGKRQIGRMHACGVADVSADAERIRKALDEALAIGGIHSRVPLPFGDGHACEKIIAHLKQYAQTADLLKEKAA